MHKNLPNAVVQNSIEAADSCCVFAVLFGLALIVTL
ncbi:unnamed protein product, partial [Rotaria magnacalcarata]